MPTKRVVNIVNFYFPTMKVQTRTKILEDVSDESEEDEEYDPCVEGVESYDKKKG